MSLGISMAPAANLHNYAIANGCTIVWFRRDLRVEDNPALIAAAKAGPVVPVFIWCGEEEGEFRPGRVSRWWLKQSLIHLDASLTKLGCPLVMRKASRDSLSVLLEVAREAKATHVYYNHLYDPVSLIRDHHVKHGLQSCGITVQTFNGDLLYEPWKVYDAQRNPFTTFQSFWLKYLSMDHEPDGPLLPPKRLTPCSGPFTTLSAEELELEDDYEKSSNALLSRSWTPGWTHANKMMDAFLSLPLLDYINSRENVDSCGTSMLSPHLHYGELSIRKLFHQVRNKQLLWSTDGRSSGEQSAIKFLRALGYREYSRYLCFHFPFTHERSLLVHLRHFPWRVDEGYFKLWRQGRTGYPLVDAGMRELWATGWLHNRIRVIVSSFCVKFLQLPWRWGMKYFWDTLLDADLESDILGWQYISGSLPDGHELDRMEVPQIEGRKFDPDGNYVRRWLPELSRLPAEWIHEPWNAPPNVLMAAGVELGCNYPRPIVELAAARDRLERGLLQMWELNATDAARQSNSGDAAATRQLERTPATNNDNNGMLMNGANQQEHQQQQQQHQHQHQQDRRSASTESSHPDQMVPTLPDESSRFYPPTDRTTPVLTRQQQQQQQQHRQQQHLQMQEQRQNQQQRPQRAQQPQHHVDDDTMDTTMESDSNSTAESSSATRRYYVHRVGGWLGSHNQHHHHSHHQQLRGVDFSAYL